MFEMLLDVLTDFALPSSEEADKALDKRESARKNGNRMSFVAWTLLVVISVLGTAVFLILPILVLIDYFT